MALLELLLLVVVFMLRVCAFKANAFCCRSTAAFPKRLAAFAASSGQSTLLERVQDTLRNEIHVLPDSTLIVGVSGGCDSVALLHLLCKIHRNNNLHVIHFDHKQRGVESDGDRQFVEHLCQSLDVPFHCCYWNFAASFSQDTARSWRRSEMRRLLDTVPTKTGHLVTAHHRDDSEETLLLKLLRGAHISRLSGMAACATDEQGVSWIRPLIHVRKSELVDYLKMHNFTWREDASNESNKYLRNRLRNELLPLMRDMVGTDSLRRRLENLEAESTELRKDLDIRSDMYLNKFSSEGNFLLPSNRSEIDLTVREAFHAFVVRESCGHLFTSFHTGQVWKQLEQHPDKRKWRLNIGDCWDIECVGDRLRLLREGELGNQSKTPVQLEWNDAENAAACDTDTQELIVFLSAESGDTRFYLSTAGNATHSFTPPWRKGRSAIPVCDFLRGQKVPLHLRSEAPVVTVKHEDNAEELIAVYVESSKAWIVDAKYCDSSKERPRRAVISLQELVST